MRRLQNQPVVFAKRLVYLKAKKGPEIRAENLPLLRERRSNLWCMVLSHRFLNRCVCVSVYACLHVYMCRHLCIEGVNSKEVESKGVDTPSIPRYMLCAA